MRTKLLVKAGKRREQLNSAKLFGVSEREKLSAIALANSTNLYM